MKNSLTNEDLRYGNTQSIKQIFKFWKFLKIGLSNLIFYNLHIRINLCMLIL